MNYAKKLVSCEYHTPLGTMTIIADDTALYLLQFSDNKDLPAKISALCRQSSAQVQPGITPIIELLKHELDLYFEGKLTQFTTPVACVGSPFSLKVWKALQTIPHQQTRSYRDLATTVGNPRAYRAVARANAVNPLAIIVPCHRVINANGTICGYNGGVERKLWLLKHEKAITF